MRSFTTECFVLKSTNFNEADKLLTLFTKSNGKVKCIAKGVRKLTSKKSGSLDDFTYVKVALKEWKDFYIVTQTETINPFLHLKKNLETHTLLYLISETLDKLLPVEQEHKELFEEVVAKLLSINTKSSAENISDLLVLILSRLGYWSNKFPKDLEFIKKYIESLSDANLNSYKFMEKVNEIYS